MALRWADGTVILPRPDFSPEFVNRVRPHVNFSWLYASASCSTPVSMEDFVAYAFDGDFYDVQGERVSASHVASRNVTKRYSIFRYLHGAVVCKVETVKISLVPQRYAAVAGEGIPSIIAFSKVTVRRFNIQTGTCHFYYYKTARCRRVEVSSTWKYAMLRLKHVLRTRARRRITSSLLPCLPCATVICRLVAMYMV